MESTLFPKQLKLDDYSEFQEGNIIRILQSSNLLVGSGARTSNTAIVVAKTIHYMNEEGAFPLKGKRVLDLGCGTGLLGIYLGCLGAHVVLADVPSVRQVAERNIGLNKGILASQAAGKAEFVCANWKKGECIGKCEQTSAKISTASSSQPRQQCLLHLISKVDLTIVCQCGGLTELSQQIRWMGKEGMLVCFMDRGLGMPEEYLERRALELFLEEGDYQYRRIEGYHPDYQDQRVMIYHISK